MVHLRNSKIIGMLWVGALLLISACGPATSQSPRQSAALPVVGQKAALIRAVDAFAGGSYQRALQLVDSLVPHIAYADSQLNYLATYYGIRARLAAGVDTADAKDFLAARTSLVPANQLQDLEFLLSPEPTEPGRQDLGPQVAYKIGVILPLSGRFYEFGEAILQGAKLAVEQFNRGADVKVELDVRDDAGEPVRAASMGRRLATDSTVAALVGSHGEEASLSLSLVSAAQNIPLVCPTADAPGLDDIGNTVHVLNRTDPQLAATVADASVRMMGLHTFAVISEDDERGRLLAGGFIDNIRKAGGAVVASLSYPEETSNFENQMAIIQRYLPDAIYLTAKSDMITQLASQVHYYGMGGVQLIGGEYWDSERVIRMGGDYVDGGLFSSPFYKESELLRWQSFKEEYESLYRRPVNRYSAYGYDAVGLILNSLERVPASRMGLARNIRSGAKYHGATGVYSVGEDGRVQRDYFVLRLASGNIVPAGSLSGGGETSEPEQNQSPLNEERPAATPN